MIASVPSAPLRIPALSFARLRFFIGRGGARAQAGYTRIFFVTFTAHSMPRFLLRASPRRHVRFSFAPARLALALSAAAPGFCFADPAAVAPPAFYCGAAAAGAALPAGGALALAELVAIGMRQNSDTRVAWSQAEEAALELGVTRSRYGPILAAQAVALHEHAAFPLPKNLDAKGYFKSDAEGFVPELSLKWRLYDGGREAALDRAAQLLARADFGFSATHRKMTIAITRQFFRTASQVALLAAARATLHSAEAVEETALARRRRGLGTAPEALQAHAQAAEARLNVEQADAAAQDARMALLEAAGLRPDAPDCVAVPAMPPTPTPAQRDAEQRIARAIAQRPEVGAALAQVRAGEAAVRQARAEYGPKLSLAAHVGQNVGRLRSDGGAWSSVDQPVYGIGLTFEIPLYDGDMRRNELRSAQSKVEAATAQLDGVRNAVIHEVVKAGHDLDVAARRRESSMALLAVADEAFDATLASYRQGLATMPELQSATAALARARTADGEAGADVLTARAVLSFAGGDLIELGP
jgi:outer membrane protein TolC